MRHSADFAPDDAPVIRFAPGIYEKMMASVGRLPPEHYAILGGSLDDPFRVTDFFPLPPLSDSAGRARQSSASVTLNAPHIEYLLNTALLPFGKYILGAMHSHPGDMTELSGGFEGSGQGDIPSMRSHLERAAELGRPWTNYLAPIVTRPGESPRVTGHVLRLDRRRPLPAGIVWEAASDVALPPPPKPPRYPQIADKHARLVAWQTVINAAATDPEASEGDRAFNAEALRVYRYLDIDRDMRKTAARYGLADGEGRTSFALPPPARSTRSRIA
jgi:hypothetical protein